jgi:hypothetical protein
LPLDATYQGFDTVGSALNVSAVQMESYLNALDTVLDSATKLYEKPERQKHRLSYLNCVGTMQVYRKNQPAVIQEDGVAMFATEKMSHMHALLDQYVVPYDGRYKVRVSAYAIRSPDPVTLTVRVGGSGHKESLEVPHEVLKHQSVYEGKPQVVEWEGWLQRGHFFHVYPSSLRPMRFIGEMLDQDLSVNHIVDSDFVIVNDRLSQLYEIPGIRGFEMRRVQLPKSSLRGGLLTQGSVLKVTANGTATSPVVRGKWVLERVLGEPPDPPPPGVPAIEPDIRGATTVLEQLKQHRNVASCAAW